MVIFFPSLPSSLGSSRAKVVCRIYYIIIILASSRKNMRYFFNNHCLILHFKRSNILIHKICLLPCLDVIFFNMFSNTLYNSMLNMIFSYFHSPETRNQTINTFLEDLNDWDL